MKYYLLFILCHYHINTIFLFNYLFQIYQYINSNYNHYCLQLIILLRILYCINHTMYYFLKELVLFTQIYQFFNLFNILQSLEYHLYKLLNIIYHHKIFYLLYTSRYKIQDILLLFKYLHNHVKEFYHLLIYKIYCYHKHLLFQILITFYQFYNIYEYHFYLNILIHKLLKILILKRQVFNHLTEQTRY